MFEGQSKFSEYGYQEYHELSDEVIQNRYDIIISKWLEFLTQNDPKLVLNKDYFVHKKNLFEIIRRCDKRNLYYFIFHGLDEICEYKDIALFCFWINTLKPFMVVNETAKVYNCPNEMFSLYLILATIEGVYIKKFPDKIFRYPSAQRIKDIIYDFKYCSLSREAMIAFVETFADTYGVGISYILDEYSADGNLK